MNDNFNKWCACIIMLVALLVPIAIALSRIIYPFDTTNYESVTWEPARLLISGQNPYHAALTLRPPYTMAAYGPVYYAFIGLGLQLFGQQLWFGRFVSLLAFGIVCFFIYRLIARLTHNSPKQAEFCCLGVGVFATLLPVGYWSGLHRTDFMALAFGLCGLLLSNFGTDLPAPTRSRLVLAAICLAAAFFCRQTTLLPVAFAIAWHWKYHRRDLLLPGMFALIVGVAVVGLQFSSQGGYLLLQWVLPSAVERSIEGLVRHLVVQFLVPSTTMVLFLALIAGREKKQMSETQHIVAWWQMYFLMASVLALVTSSRWGGNVNYWLEPCAVGAILTALALAHRNFGMRARQVVLATVFFSCCALGALMAREEYMRWQGLRYLQEVVVALHKYVPPDQPVAVVHADLAVAAGRTPWFNDFFQYENSPQHHRIFEEVVKSRKVGAIVHVKPTPPGYRRVYVENKRNMHGIYLDLREDIYQKQHSHQ